MAKPDLAGWLAGFDANLNADIGTLTVAGVPVQQAKLDGTLTNGTLAVRQFRTTDLAGIAGSVQGSVGKLQPLDDMELTVDLKAASLAQFYRTFPSLANQPVQHSGGPAGRSHAPGAYRRRSGAAGARPDRRCRRWQHPGRRNARRA